MRSNKNSGFVLITVFLMLGLLTGLLGVYYVTTSIETATMRYSKGAASGFYSAEAGLNLRAEQVRQTFVGFNVPTGVSPTAVDPCEGTNMGSGSFACQLTDFNNRSVMSYVTADPSNPVIITIPPGERYQNLNAQEFRYTAKALARNVFDNLEADLELRFKSRLVPLFQFAAFYNKDLEILPGPTMTLSGPVHTNGNLYLYSNSASLTIQGQVTAAGDIWRGRKDGSVSPSCSNQQVYVFDPLSARSLIPSCPSRVKVTNAQITPFNNMIQMNIQPVTVPGPEVFDPTPGQVYWDRADLRLVLRMTAADAPAAVEVRDANDANVAAHTASLNGCTGAVSGRPVGFTSIYNYREAAWIRILDVDMLGTLNCLRSTNWFGTGKSLNDSTEGGLVFHLTVKGPNSSATPNTYGVRVRNGTRIYSNLAGAPAVRGITIVSDQAAYVWGNFNSTNKIPAAIMADSVNVLSTNWSDSNSNAAIGSRVAANTTINAAFLAGTDTTGGVEGVGGQGGAYNGGLENYPRLHENWSNRTFTYRGSFVSLGTPRRVDGLWSAQSYNPPIRDWNYDTSFNNAANLPPITPRFVYLKQELFVRDFEQ